MERKMEENPEKQSGKEKSSDNNFVNKKPTFLVDEEWVKQYIEDFGTEPSFF